MRAPSSSLPTTVHGTTTRCELALAHSTTARAIWRRCDPWIASITAG